nr:peroxiredoxin [Candidatus Enterousia merdequi]
MPLIGDIAPHFKAQTTNGEINFPEDYHGKWVILFSHPMDFTPVCTTEFLSFQMMIEEFQKINTELIGLSAGGISSHLAWFRSIHDEIDFKGTKNISITFPVITDLDLSIAKLYGMIHPNSSTTKTLRSVFIIDKDSIIRTILYYPQTTGRNIKEIFRIVTALQTADTFKVLTPADWIPGKPVLEPAPQNLEAMNKRLTHKEANQDVKTWYLTYRDLPETTIYEQIIKS